MSESAKSPGLDKFYTVPAIAERCIQAVGLRFSDWSAWDAVIEPSAGNGSFFLRLPATSHDKRIGLDIAPEHPDIQQQDFLTYTPLQTTSDSTTHPRILVIGNPPFGRVSSLAIKFFNHAAKWATVIAFIVPRTFRRISVQNRLDTRFHLVHDEEIPMEPCAFTPPMMAKCCFQIWERRDTERVKTELPTSHADWIFLPFGPKDDKGQPTPPRDADFAIRAYGGKCGELVDTRLDALRPKSWHWIRCTSRVDKPTLMGRFRSLDYSLSQDTARQNSIGRGELVRLYADVYDP